MGAPTSEVGWLHFGHNQERGPPSLYGHMVKKTAESVRYLAKRRGGQNEGRRHPAKALPMPVFVILRSRLRVSGRAAIS
jgi:hypothetical protein